MHAAQPHPTPPTLTEILAQDILRAIDQGSATALMEALAAVTQLDPATLPESLEQEQMDLLRGIAIQLRLDLQAVLMHLYQRIEASRTYIAMLRHLAGEDPAAQSPSLRIPAPVLPWPLNVAMPERMDDAQAPMPCRLVQK